VFGVASLFFASHSYSQTPDAPSNAYAPTRAQVYVAKDSQATDAFQPRPERVKGMVQRAILAATSKDSVSAAWLSLVSTQDIIGIKVYSDPGPNSGTRRAVVAAVVEDLLNAGIPTNHVIVWDKRLIDLRLAGYMELNERFGIQIVGSTDGGYDGTNFYESTLIGNLVWGDLEFGKKGDDVGRKSFVSNLVSRKLTRIINIAPLINHNQAGVAGILYSLALGSVDNTRRFENDASRLATAVPEIYALPALVDHVALNITDALICQYEGEERGLLHYSSPLNQLWFSHDPVALDVLAIQELDRQRQLAKFSKVKSNLELYFNASLLELGVSDLKKIQVIDVP